MLALIYSFYCIKSTWRVKSIKNFQENYYLFHFEIFNACRTMPCEENEIALEYFLLT